MNNNFKGLRKFLVPEFVFGEGSYKLVFDYLANYHAKKVFIVTDSGIIQAGLLDKLTELLEDQFLYTIYSNVTPNPRDFEVMEGADKYADSGCDVILAIGGGSVIDCAKGIGIVVSNKRHILEFEGVDRVKTSMPPLICIPTTGGTSADVSQFAIIRDSDEKVKIAIISKAIVPDVALIDPVMLTTMDAQLTATTGIDALVHAVEAFVSNAGSSITDIHAVQAIKLIRDNLVNSIKEPFNIQYRQNVMLGSLEAGMAFSNASLGLVHAMAHSLGGYLDLPHGECNALLLNSVVDYNYTATPEKFDELGRLLGLELNSYNLNEKKKLINGAIASFIKETGITGNLTERGVSSSDIPYLAKHAYTDPCIITNPRMANKRDIEVIYEESL